jgi:thioredoxin reductase (NADPH)
MVVLEGEIEILSDRDTLVTVHHPGNFSGDVDLIAGHPAVVRARARLPGRILEVPAERVRSLIVSDPELSQIFLRAFILRRALLMTRSAGNVVLIGSRHSAGTLTLQEFLTRNNQPYAYLDADRDSAVQTMLEGFAVGVDDVPVFICSGKQVLKKPTIEEVAECLGLNRWSRDVVRDLVVIGAGPAGWRPRCTGHRRAWTCSFWSRPRRAGRRARAPASRTISDSPRASQVRTLRTVHSCRPKNSAQSSSWRERR